ncbi:phage minor capsid protein [Ligilactobacillus acidipiscis]|uniref:phage minor capsid protein n=1 Tax=Ligilactobacillus acidipiscis TaxID=89059 RepID=UPI0023F70FFD|nr:phage minor capsid protein [Ligilactobacillus acidipiscis]WEV56139.1 minor capsid protein [Ligilactobacillus acidipiscis]
MAQPIMTMAEMQRQAEQTTNYYSVLQQKIFYLLIDTTKSVRKVEPKNILQWRLEQLSKMHALTNDVIKLVSRTSGQSEKAIRRLIHKDGLQVAKRFNNTLSRALKTSVPISSEIHDIIDGFAHQTFRDMDNYVNQSLLTTNYGQNSAMRAYQGILNQTVIDVSAGNKTPQRALFDNVYKWHQAGLKTNLVDRGGHNWSLEGYTRTVMNTTAGRVYNDVSIQSMKDFNSPLATMTSHAAAREACAPIQGHIVNIVPTTDERYDPEYDSIYNHDYGKPSGTMGINCAHRLYPYIKGVSHNVQPQYDPQEAIGNMKVQQKQRYFERYVRQQKTLLNDANRMNDTEGINKYKSNISAGQRNLRNIVKSHDFLTRQYDREQIVRKGE